ncbi:replication initiation factor domain-containing protein [Spongiibacter tropicus]|uniref:replication initiation factor domain-containing protein n=1 Tax=Spongiibacter tropicus TaxID=454602 RepID=UPI0024E23539|nr:replication initiation factor domain-containing protein [Spongiibacter tropicus]
MSEANRTPSVIRGESPTGEILLDALTVTMPISAFRLVAGTVSRWTHSDEQVIAGFQTFLNVVFGSSVFELEEAVVNGINGFDHRIHFKHRVGFIAFGGNNTVYTPAGEEKRPERFQIQLHGEGCAFVTDWHRVYKALSKFQRQGHDVRITRLDIACDFHDGAKTVDDAITAYQAGEFTTRGRPPACNHIDDMGTGNGRTFYVGNRKNGKLLRVYEKGKQLGDKLSAWVRWELELRNKDREIPLEALIEPQQFIAGAYPATGFISAIQQVIKTCREKTRITYEHARYWCRLQYGKLLNFAHVGLGLSQESIFHEFFNPAGFPDRLTNAALAANPQEVYA